MKRFTKYQVCKFDNGRSGYGVFRREIKTGRIHIESEKYGPEEQDKAIRKADVLNGYE